MLEFLRLDVFEPVPSYGLSLEEYASDERVEAYVEYYKNMGVDMSYNEAYENRKAIWERHCPPAGVKGLFVFVNRPENIDVNVIPGEIKRELRENVIEVCNLQDLDKYEQLEEADNWLCQLLPIADMSISYKYTIDDVSRVFAHFYGDNEWWEYDPAEFERYCTEEVYECFIELK